MKNILLIANPIAGGDAQKKIRRAEDYLLGRGHRVEVLLTRARGDARSAGERARAGGFDLIIAAGGDGTLNEVVNGLAPSATPLAFLPLGTTNVFALEAGIPFAVEKACAVALDGTPHPVCLGKAGEERFLLMAGIGFDADVVENVDGRTKRRAGKLAYVVSGLKRFLRYRHPPLEVRADDGQVVPAYGVILCNSRCYGGRFAVTPRASLTRDRLEAFLLERPGRLALLGVVGRLLLRRPMAPALGRILPVSRLEVRGEEVPVQVDGDFFGHLPLKFSTTFGEINLVFPPQSAQC